MCGYKCAAERGRLCAGNSPRVQHVRAGPGVFVDGLLSFTHQWDGGTELLHHGELSSQSSCLNGQAQRASLFIRGSRC